MKRNVDTVIGCDYPSYFYKYRAIDRELIEKAKSKKDFDVLNKDYALDALFNNYAVFSSRINFNDLFDSKVNLLMPSPEEIKEFSNSVINHGGITQTGCEFFQKFSEKINTILDSYPIFSVSTNPASNLMWSHYADSHQGFCIEFKSEQLKAEKIEYRETIPQLRLLDTLPFFCPVPGKEEFAKDLRSKLLIKLREWKYEDEYRFLASKTMSQGRVPVHQKFVKNNYDSTWVESIIFGVRIDKEVKEFIKKKISFPVKFKKAEPDMTKGIINIIEDN
jgi:hypothetical protein